MEEELKKLLTKLLIRANDYPQSVESISIEKSDLYQTEDGLWERETLKLEIKFK